MDSKQGQRAPKPGPRDPMLTQQPTSRLLAISAILRVALIAFGEWQDSHLSVPYTDIDYFVFSDAADLVSRGRSPFQRATYRYSPLLAYLLLPNVWIHRAFGKVLFAALDILVAQLLVRLHRKRTSLATPATQAPIPANQAGIPATQAATPATQAATKATQAATPATQAATPATQATTPATQAATPATQAATQSQPGTQILNLCLLLWLANPYTAAISTRGNGDSLVVAAQLGLALLLEHDAMVAGGVVYGALVHWRLFPIIYAPAIVLHVWEKLRCGCGERGKGGFWRSLKYFVHAHILSFAIASSATFLLLTAAFYRLYGMEYLNEAVLYHLDRRDHRHNFSVHFYYVYLSYFDGSPAPGFFQAALQALSLWPQLFLWILAAWKLRHDLVFCFYIQTLTMVAFNKVITAQYFVWYLGLLPALVPRLLPHWKALSVSTGIWLAAQLHWLLWAYLLEFKGLEGYVYVWMASIVFFLANVQLIVVQLLVYAKSAKQK